MKSGPYQILLLGSRDGRQDQLKDLVLQRIADAGLDRGVVEFIDQSNAAARDPRAPIMAMFFGSHAHTADTPLIQALLDDSIVVVTLVSSLDQVQAELPSQLRGINALAFGPNAIERVATLVLETFRLLRRERKIFISYRRSDSQPFANRLYDALDAHGFDVFIDVRSVPPAVDFQSELWHRMSDSDVVVLVDTPGFRESRWTTAELAQANATNIQILHVLWPGQPEDSASSFSHFLRLNYRDFQWFVPGHGKWVRRHSLERICVEAERLRARAIAARYRYLVDNFCDAARDLGMHPVVQPEEWIALDIHGKKPLIVVPAVGVPTADRINDIHEQIGTGSRDIWIIYDNRGILNKWLEHLDWLDQHLPLRTVRMVKAPNLLRDLLA